MGLNHINLVVKEVDQAVSLFADYFGFSLITNRNSKMAVLERSHQFVLVIWGQELNRKDEIPEYPENFHIGFYQEDEGAVREIYNRLKEVEGLKLDSEPKKIRNTFGFYFYFEKLMIEISVNPFKENIA
ncbi:VOC family protein [Chryseobacterium camelliae]|uniref:VOC family protein n=1 Tax=Chryseobacterium camelliae TaxID=1265445 RepID=UPI002866B27F|nr:VOC family protein [Chryseobacterium camelliae]MDR6513480.1 catechol 2,3-dioxygenase-like lactoylglutathione lyase family enzyme [Chryseobacterium camelliae]